MPRQRRIQRRRSARNKPENLCAAGPEGPIFETMESRQLYSADITSDLVGHYTFDAGSGSTVIDATGNADGVFENSTAYVGRGAVGADAGEFDGDASGSNRFVTVADNAAQDFGTGDFSVGLWYRADVAPTSSARLAGDFSGSGTGFVFFTSGSNIQYQLEGPGGRVRASTPGIYDGDWHHLLISRSSDTVSLYVDGVLDSTETGASAIGSVSTANALNLGASSSSGGDFEGQLDDVRLYTRGLAADDAQALFELANAPLSADLAITSRGDVVTGGSPGVDTFDNSEVLSFAGATYDPGPGGTSGTFASVFDINDHLAGDFSIDAFHHVTTAVTVGDIAVENGDVILSLAESGSVSGTAFGAEDLLLFRPDAVGNYTSGTVSFFIDTSAITGTDSGTTNVSAVALVERDVAVGDADLNAGDLLLARETEDVLRVELTVAGSGTAGNATTLLDGTDFLIIRDKFTTGLHVASEEIVVGDTTLTAGTLLISNARDTDTAGDNGNDIFRVNLTTTGNNTNGTRDSFFDGSDVSLNTAEEDVDGLSLLTATAVNDAPIAATIENTSVSYIENQAPVQVTDTITFSDADNTELESATVQITSGFLGTEDVLAFTSQFDITGGFDADTGILALSGNATLAEYQTVIRSVTYANTSDNPNAADRTVSFSVNDGTANSNTPTRDITVTPVNDAPTLASSGGDTGLGTITEDDVDNNGRSVAEVLGVGTSDAIFEDVDNDPAGIAVFISTPRDGRFEYSLDGGVTWEALGSVDNNNARLLGANDRLRYVPDGVAGGNANLGFRAWDGTQGNAGELGNTVPNGGSSAFSNQTRSSVVFFTNVNDAPVLDNSGDVSLNTQAEDAGAPTGAVGTLISDLVSLDAGSGNVTDVDNGATTGVAITGADTTNGTYFYTTNGGSTWIALGSVSDSSARVLRADSNTRIYFQSNPNYNGTVTEAITFRAWDRTQGGNGTLQDASTNGGSSAFSSDTETANIAVTAVNDAPTITDGPDTSSLVETDAALTVSGTFTKHIANANSALDHSAALLSRLVCAVSRRSSASARPPIPSRRVLHHFVTGRNP